MGLPVERATSANGDSSATLSLSESDQLSRFLKQCHESRTGGEAKTFETLTLLDDSPEWGLT
jgi:hypothetical protein